MNGAVAVRTENGEILKSRSDRLCRLRQRPPVVNLANKEGLPATPFRTDDWDMITKPKSTPGATAK